MSEYSRCPKCGSYKLKYINESLADFDCQDCGQRMNKRDYIEWALKNFNHKINIYEMFLEAYEGINEE